ncbi:MAG TPA: AsmA-like C-terminal region-containing protein [Candidatus Hydrogenedens sp.]|nr:AsmA-like C-terminal region-containing protein [Candidatus Hydrogenedens sp.]HOL18810.1 AsmA-like C-terminal region-containing protein [Candidatus Hydrogenedens sp.]HPP59278.1 AsmA-like C-terminal region-containing protein [Candidatus Hydrogenedens sp.]
MKENFERDISKKVNGHLVIGKIIPNGLRGLRIDDIQFRMDYQGIQLQAEIPRTVVHVNWVNLFYREWSFDMIQIAQSDIKVNIKDPSFWENIRSEKNANSAIDLKDISFRVVGERNNIVIQGLIPEHEIQLKKFSFDCYRLSDSSEIRMKLDTTVSYLPEIPDETSLNLDLRFRSLEDFDLRAESNKILLSQIEKVVSFSDILYPEGAITPSLRVAGYPNQTLIIALEAPFEDIKVKSQNVPFQSITGEITALADLKLAEKRLRITTADITSEEFDGSLSGLIFLDKPTPELDITLEVRKIPLEDLITSFTQQQVEKYGNFVLTFDQLNNLRFGVKGTIKKPMLEALADVTNGTIQFNPNTDELPTIQARLELVKIGWVPEGQLPRGTLVLKDGIVEYRPLKIKVDNISATCILDTNELTIDSLSGIYNDSLMTLKGNYKIQEKTGIFTINGTLNGLENLPFIKKDDDVSLSGSATFQTTLHYTPEKISAQLNAELTSADIGYEWWFHKRIGVGATIPELKVDIIPKKSLIIDGIGQLESTPLNARFEYAYFNKKFNLRKVNITSSALDINTASKCLNIPYQGRGGVGKNGSFLWEKKGKNEKYGETMKISVDIDWASFLAKETEIPLEAKDVSVQAFIDERDPNNRTRMFTITAKEATIPPIGVKWLIPLRSKEEAEAERIRKKEPPGPPEYWTFVLNSEKITMLPWEGTNFKGIAYDRPDSSGLDRFSANVGNGTLEGSYSVSSPENVSVLKAQWKNIPVIYLVRHLNLPEAIEGECTGNVEYSLDLDDANTLSGKGSFQVVNGKVETDLFLSRFAPETSSTGIPTTLPFYSLKSDVTMEKDLIKTPNLQFRSEGLQIDGKGQFIIDGDMDYDLSFTFSPQLASQITVIRDSFNIRGHQIIQNLIQNPIQLGFRVHGPSFSPKGQVKELPPLGVTIVSGAAEITTEAFRVIDIPRRILVDLLKIGGSVIGSTTQPQTQK